MKDNKLIAEFMGYDISTIASSGVEVVEFESKDTKVENLKYRTSWDWLMPVANEIIKSRDEQNEDWDLTNLKYALCTTNIEYVYKAVVEFIKENQQIMNRADLKEQMQENLLTYFDAITLGTQTQHTEAMDGMCDVVIKTIDEHERQ